MDQPSAGLAIQGLLSPVIVEDHSDIQKHISGCISTGTDKNKERENSEEIFEGIGENESEILHVENSRNAIQYYKLEIIRIQLITAQGHQVTIKPLPF
jgi:methionine salvage enolase-phosphatase E1